ncbi:MAG TPA: hypothetical protein VLE19_07535 [Pyrinomonadaceae bacterium]|nr:hypothetical protein [Pyrinomonadaceae bacterium]
MRVAEVLPALRLLTLNELETNELFTKEFKEHLFFYRLAYFYDGARDLAVL